MKFNLILLLSFFVLLSCKDSQMDKEKSANEILVFASEKLSIPLKEMAKLFERSNPDLKVKIEFSENLPIIHKAAQPEKDGDIVVLTDYTAIEQSLVPKYADWNIKFASDEIEIAYIADSKYANEINDKNWFRILGRADVHFGRSDPNSAACGYHTMLMMKLAEDYYRIPELANSLLAKDKAYIGQNDSALLTLLESGTIDYLFTCKSVIKQQKLKSLVLPDSINLKYLSMAKVYSKVSVEIHGGKQGKTIVKKGAPIISGITILKDAPHKENALKFLQYILSEKGRIIMNINGLSGTIPSTSPTFDKIPEILQPFARPE